MHGEPPSYTYRSMGSCSLPSSPVNILRSDANPVKHRGVSVTLSRAPYAGWISSSHELSLAAPNAPLSVVERCDPAGCPRKGQACGASSACGTRASPVPGRAEPDRSRDRGWDRMAVKTGYRGFKN